MSGEEIVGLPDFYVSLSVASYIKFIDIRVSLKPEEECVTIEITTKNFDTIKLTMVIRDFEKFVEKVNKAMEYINENW